MDMTRTNVAGTAGRVQVQAEPRPATANQALIKYYELQLRLLRSQAAELERLLEVLREG